MLLSDVFGLRWKQYWKGKCETALNVKFTQNLVLSGTEIDMKTDSVFDLVILQAKQFIYKFKLDKCLPTITRVSCRKYHFCRDKCFVTTNTCLSREKTSFVASKVCLSRWKFCRDKIKFVATKSRDKYSSWQARVCRAKCFVATSILLSRQKGYLWQLPPTLTCFLQQLMLKYKTDQRPIVHFQLELALL